MSKYLIACDDGHGMETAGKRTPALKEDVKFRGKVYKKGSCIHENDFNENIMELFIEGCKRCDIGTMQVAPGDTDIPLATRVSKANSNKADLYISFHANALAGNWQTKAYGLVVIKHENCSAKTNTLANNVYDYLKNDVNWYSNGATKYGVRKDTDISGYSLYVLRKTSMPSILIEYGFMDNWEDVKVMCTDKFAKDCAEATLKGVCKTLGVKYIAPNETTSSNNTPSQSITETDVNQTGLVNATSLNVRSGAGINYSVLGKLKDNVEVTIIAKCSNGWLKIKFNNVYGYVSGQYIDNIKNIQTSSSTQLSGTYIVRYLQQVLNSSYKLNLDVDGLYGTKTKNAVKSHLLKQGCRGEHVIWLQKALINRGYKINADGIFGNDTLNAVKKYQQSRGLKADGYAGVDTHTAIVND